jgi:hypothetical protein
MMERRELPKHVMIQVEHLGTGEFKIGLVDKRDKEWIDCMRVEAKTPGQLRLKVWEYQDELLECGTL